MLRHGSVVRPQCVWQSWTSRRRSTRQDLGMSQKLWKVATPIDGQFRPCCARCPGYRDRRCSNAWRASSHSIDVSAKVASKLPDWQKMAMQLLANVEEVWVRKGKWNSSGPEKTEEAPDLQLHVDRQLLGHVPFQESLGADAEGSDSGSSKCGIWHRSGQACGGQVLMIPKRRLIFQFFTKTGRHRFPF